MPTPSSSKVVLVPASRGSRSAGVRRYRLARLSVNPEPGAERDGFEHLKRTYD